MITSDLHKALQPFLAQYEQEQVVVVADEAIHHPLGFDTFVIEGGEKAKTIETVQQIWDFLFDHHLTRRGLIICIGGGVITDLGGFAAATYKRGIDYINIPTTLLAMIDASTGGKTGCNYRGYKNAIGAFHSPLETIIYLPWLHTLPSEAFLSGYAEMLKTGLIETSEDRRGTERLWDALMRYDLGSMALEPLAPLVEQCVRVKSRIVAADPQESGLRKTLNLGHTFGHALEELSGMIHGYAVLYGLIAELYLSVTLLDFPREPLQQLTQLMIHDYGKPSCRCSDRERLVALMHEDKKNEHPAEINCTLLRGTGEAVINQVITDEQAQEAWEYLFSL